MTASKWLLERCWTLETATARLHHGQDAAPKWHSQMKYRPTPPAPRSRSEQCGRVGALAPLNRYAARHSREWHKAVDKLRTIQAERRAEAAEKQELPNEPADVVEKETPSIQNPQRDRRDSGISQNEPENTSNPRACNRLQTIAPTAIRRTRRWPKTRRSCGPPPDDMLITAFVGASSVIRRQMPTRRPRCPYSIHRPVPPPAGGPVKARKVLLIIAAVLAFAIGLFTTMHSGPASAATAPTSQQAGR